MRAPRKPPAELEWTLDDIPDEVPPSAAPEPPRSAPRRPRLTVTRRGVSVILIIVGVLGLGAWLTIYLGWQNLRAQIAREAAYEDAQSLAGAVEAVIAVQVDDETWRAVRAAEVAQHLPAPLPAAHLLPSGDPPTLTDLHLIDTDLFEATLQRTWVDSAGQTFAFDYTQRYRNLGPGLWERLPPETVEFMDVLNDGGRVAASFPLAESDFFRPLLAQVNRYLQATCADWRCPPNLYINVQVYDYVSAYSLAPSRPAWTPGLVVAPYPLAFDLYPATPTTPVSGPLVMGMPSLRLAGWPHDAAARQAMLHALTVQALSRLIALQVPPGQPRDVFAAALVARAEVRLGLAPVVDYAPDPATYRSPQSAWALLPPDEATHLADQQQAQALLDFALTNAAPGVEYYLLSSLAGESSVAAWLNLDTTGASVLRAWNARMQLILDARAHLPRANLAGLAYSCGVNAALLTADEVLPLPIQNNWVAVQPEALSPDGRYFAAIERIDPLHINLRLIDLDTGLAATVDGSGDIQVLGWTPDGRLLYQRQEDVNQLAQFAQLDPATRQWRPWLTSGPGTYATLPVWWTPDHARFYVSASLPVADLPGEFRLTRIAVAGDGTVEARLAFPRGGTLAPDGHYAVGVTAAASDANLPATPAGLIVVSADAQSVRQLVALDDLRVDGSRALMLTPLEWSPDGASLAFVARGGRYGVRVFTIGAEGAGLREHARFSDRETVITALAFSPDGAYLAFQVTAADGADAQTIVTNLATGDQIREPLAGHAGLAWAPAGHRLALVTQDGVKVRDLDTGAIRWVTLGPCDHLAWYPLP